MSAEKKLEEESSKLQDAVDSVLGEDVGESTGLTLVDGDIDFSELNDNSAQAQEEGMDLDLGADISLNFVAEGDEVENVVSEVASASDLDLDINDEVEISLAAEGEEVENVASDFASSGDLDLDAMPPVTENSEVEAQAQEEVETTDEIEEDIEAELDSMDLSDDLGDLDDLDSMDDIDGQLDSELDDLDSMDLSDDLGDLDDVDAQLDDLDLSADSSDVIDELDSLDVDAAIVEDIEEKTATLPQESPDFDSLDMKDTQDINAFVEDDTAEIPIVEEEATTTAVAENFGIDAESMTRTIEVDTTMLKDGPVPIEQVSGQINLQAGQILSSLGEDQLMDLRVSLKELKEDRVNLLSEIQNLKTNIEVVKRDNLTLNSSLDEKSIELAIARKRHSFEAEETKALLDTYKHNLELSEAKNSSLKEEIFEVSSKVQLDHAQVRKREQELESQLELMAIDSDNKIKSRDEKILELKRKIDALEFNMEHMSIRERQAKKSKKLVEQKLERLISTLRGSLNVVSDTIDIDDSLDIEN